MKRFLYMHRKKFVVVKTPKEIVLVPIAKEPFAELKKLDKKADIDKYSLSELKKIARQEAERETFSILK